MKEINFDRCSDLARSDSLGAAMDLQTRIEQATKEKIARNHNEEVRRKIESKRVGFCDCLICKGIRKRAQRNAAKSGPA